MLQCIILKLLKGQRAVINNENDLLVSARIIQLSEKLGVTFRHSELGAENGLAALKLNTLIVRRRKLKGAVVTII